MAEARSEPVTSVDRGPHDYYHLLAIAAVPS